METVTIGMDIAKSVFVVHGVDAAGEVVIRRRLTRRKVLPFFEKLPACLVGIEACAAAHYWGRQLRELGHDVRLMPPSYVKPYVKRQKNDAADAEAICEAVTRPTMRFVAIKTPRAAKRAVSSPGSADADPPANPACQCHPRPHGRVRAGGTGRAQWSSSARIIADPDDDRLPETHALA